jgi:hypothetical protein
MRFSEINGSHILNEVPQVIPATNFDLEISTNNLRLSGQIIHNKSLEVLEDTPTYRLVKTGHGQNGFYARIQKSDNRITYLVKYESNTYFGKAVTQVAIWRDPLSNTSGLARDIFFDHLLTDWPTIISDERQTIDGRRFWLERMAEAVQFGFAIGLLNLNHRSIDWFSGSDFRSWIEDRSGAWGDSATRPLRFVISRAHPVKDDSSAVVQKTSPISRQSRREDPEPA